MALKSRTPLNLNALRRDYSMLPKIAALKAQANQQMIGAIQSGLQKRKEKIEKKEKNALNEKILKDLIASDPNNTIVPPDMDEKELAKIITLPESLAYRRALIASDKASAQIEQMAQADRFALNQLIGNKKLTAEQEKRISDAIKANPGMIFGAYVKRLEAEPKAPPKPSVSIQDYEYYKGTLAPGETPVSFIEFQNSKKDGTTINVGGGFGKLSDKLSEGGAEQVFKSREKAEDSIGVLRANKQNRELLERGMITGAKGASFVNQLNKLLVVAGFNVNPDVSANTDAYLANVAKQTATIIKDFGAGTGLSDADREFATKAAGGDISMSREALERILDINDTAAVFTLKKHKDLISKLPEGSQPFDLSVPVPKEFEETYNEILRIDDESDEALKKILDSYVD